MEKQIDSSDNMVGASLEELKIQQHKELERYCKLLKCKHNYWLILAYYWYAKKVKDSADRLYKLNVRITNIERAK